MTRKVLRNWVPSDNFQSPNERGKNNNFSANWGLYKYDRHSSGFDNAEIRRKLLRIDRFGNAKIDTFHGNGLAS